MRGLFPALMKEESVVDIIESVPMDFLPGFEEFVDEAQVFPAPQLVAGNGVDDIVLRGLNHAEPHN